MCAKMHKTILILFIIGTLLLPVITQATSYHYELTNLLGYVNNRATSSYRLQTGHVFTKIKSITAHFAGSCYMSLRGSYLDYSAGINLTVYPNYPSSAGYQSIGSVAWGLYGPGTFDKTETLRNEVPFDNFMAIARNHDIYCSIYIQANSGAPASGYMTITSAWLDIEEEPVTVAVTGVTLNKSLMSLAKGESSAIVATISPTTATNKNVTWSSSNTSVAKVDATGMVTAVGGGSCDITATTVDGGFKASCAVNVGVSLSAKVKLGNYTGDVEGVPVKIDLRSEDGSRVLRTEDTTLDVDGKFHIHNVAPGRYRVGIKPSHWLRKVTEPLEVTSADLDFVIK